MIPALALLALLAAGDPAAPEPGPGEAAGRVAADAPAPGAESPTPPAARAAEAAAAGRRDRWFALPVLFWLPETRLGVGGTAGVHLDVAGAPRSTSLFAGAVYTLERQFALDVAGDWYLPGGARLAGRARASYFPDVFYGIGPSTTAAQREAFTRRFAEAVVSAQLPLPGVPDLLLGPRMDLRAEAIGDRRAGGALATGAVTGASGYSAAAFGAALAYDTRDGAFWPTRGAHAQAWYVHAPEGTGRHRPFGRGVLDVARFLPLGRGRVLGLQAYAEGAHGDPPFTLLPKIGSTRFLRGIREGRYRDRLDWAVQAELRARVRGRIAAVAFLGLGDVAPRPSALTLRHPKPTAGAGLRYRLTDDGVNVRVDLATSGAGLELYVLVLEAF